jgi:hypothetical protein
VVVLLIYLSSKFQETAVGITDFCLDFTGIR